MYIFVNGQKIDLFQTDQSRDFVKKWTFWNKSRESVWWFSIQLTSRSRREKCRFVSGQKVEIFQRGQPIHFAKIGIFLTCFFFRKTSLEKLFGDFLFGKQAILDETNVVFWIAENYIFQMG